MTIETVNQMLALATIGAQVVIVVGLLLVVVPKTRILVVSSLGKHGIPIAFFVALAAASISLFYSNYVGYPPCELCWWQRIFMYPQVLLLGIAWYERDKKITSYALPLAVLGAVVSLYQNYLSWGGSALWNCAAAVDAVSCTQRFVFEFGFVTIPLMSLTSFALVIFFLGLSHANAKK